MLLPVPAAVVHGLYPHTVQAVPSTVLPMGRTLEYQEEASKRRAPLVVAYMLPVSASLVVLEVLVLL